MSWIVLGVGIGLVWLGLRGVRRAGMRRRGQLIDSYRFPPAISDKVAAVYPHLTPAELERVMTGLRDYFHVCNIAGKRMVSMPSQVVDQAWHEFILFTRHYEHFCKKALGRFLHHTPAEAMSTPTLAQTGIKRAWKIACLRESIPPHQPHRLPTLFALDAELKIPDGFTYSLNCRTKAGFGGGYCASDIGCGSGCGGSSASGCVGDGGSGCGGDSGGGCGGGD